MTVRGLGTRRQRRQLPILALFSGGLLLAALSLSGIQLVRFGATRDLLQTDVTVGGVPVGGLPLSEAVKAWETVYAQPVEIDYGNSPILLYPAQIEFVVSSDQLRSQVQSRSAGNSNYWLDFWNYLWQRPSSPVDIPLAANYQQAKLRDFLNDVATRYEQHASGANFDLATMTFGSGANGAQIDIEAAIPMIDQALRRPTDRKVTLPLKTVGASGATMDTLHSAIVTYLENVDYLGNKGISFTGPDTVGGMVVIDLNSGLETSINPDVAFSAESTIKIPIMMTQFKELKTDPDTNADPTLIDTKWLMGASILCSSDDATNGLLALSGSGPDKNSQIKDGLQQVINTVKTLGATNTYINAPIYVGDTSLQFSIPAPKTSPDKRYNAHPDPFSQTTPSDMATLLKELYDCTEYGSGLRAVYPNDFTQKKCQEMTELLSGNIIGRLIELGVPPGTRVAHKNGWGGTETNGANASDAAIVFTPGGNYILVVYFWEKYNNQGLGSLDSWRMIEGMSRLVYNFFNPTKPLITPRVPENPNGAVNCVLPNPYHPELVSFENINNGRFDSSGNLVPDACVNYPGCLANKPTPAVPPTRTPAPGT